MLKYPGAVSGRDSLHQVVNFRLKKLRRPNYM